MKKPPVGGWVSSLPIGITVQIFFEQVDQWHLMNPIRLYCSNITHLTDHQLICCGFGIPPMPPPNMFLKEIRDVIRS